VRQVPARCERHPENGVSRLQQRQEHCLVGLGPRMRLDVREAALEQLPGALDREPFGDIDELAPAVVTPTGITLGVFVGQHRALRGEHCPRDDILTGDQLDLPLLALALVFNRRGQLGISLEQGGQRATVDGGPRGGN